jgi:deoxyribodipyrimidine photo-lyase
VPDTLLWFRRDLRLDDHPALQQAVGAADGGQVLPLFVIDPRLWDPAGPIRRAWLVRSLAALSRSMSDALVIRHGDPAQVVPQVARELAAGSVHVSADAGPYGRRRDDALDTALGEIDVQLIRTGTPYAVGPGRVTKGDGSPYRVFTPFSRAWAEHGWPGPAASPPTDLAWARGLPSQGLPDGPGLAGTELPEVGELAALRRWRQFLDEGLESYADARDRADLAGTSGLSAHLKYGEIHPRTMLADLAGRAGPGPTVYRTELAWREFYADVLWHRPDTAREYLRPEYARMRYDPPGDALSRWQQGRTGYPFVDAGMRQLRGTGWMHNRVRMVVASFLVKDLHIEWQHGARFFMRWLRDGDLASNNHGWQWVAGSGTDASPYYRVFNPVNQGQKFDPDGKYVRRWVPELRHLPGKSAHEPWAAPDGYAEGYPARMVDHAQEREEALSRLTAMRG